MKIRIDGINETINSLEKIKSNLEREEEQALLKSGREVLSQAMDVTPIFTGKLISSGKVTLDNKDVYVSFNAYDNGFDYATYVHNNTHIKHPIHINPRYPEDTYDCGGHAKYLSAPFEANEELIIRTIGEHIEKACKV